jgi:uncharacterized protein (DUF885 family)
MVRKVTTVICAAATTLLLLVAALPAQQRNVDEFFRDFTADWVRHDVDLATRTRYFTGGEQDRVERQLRPWTLEWKKERIERAKQGLAQLRKFDRAKMSEVQQVSADLMQWQLQIVAEEEPYLTTASLEHFMGQRGAGLFADGGIRRDGERCDNYVAALGEVNTRLKKRWPVGRRRRAFCR